MSKTAIILGIVDILVALILIFVVLFQHGKSANLSGAIAGGAETFFGKNKGRTIDAILSKWTTVVAIVFVLITVVLNGLALTGKI
jgi:preprotein translocase subunit SecG